MYVFETGKAEENFVEKVGKDKNYNFSRIKLVDTHSNLPSRRLKTEQKESIFLTLKIFADKQYDFDKSIYLAEGNVKALINGGILRCDLLRYEKSTGILSAEGNVRFIKGRQYFRAKEFKFNLINKKGIIKNTYGILDVKNVLTDLKVDTNANQLETENTINSKENSIYNDGIEFAFGNLRLSENKITRSNKSIGLINNWRFKSDSIVIEENGWRSNRIIFTNDPFDPHQISFEGIDVIAEEDDNGKLLITSSKTNLILENRTKIFLGKRIFVGSKKKKNRFQFKFDPKDRDGLFLIRKIDTKSINNIKLDFQPQFLINRSILGKTYSYKNNQNKNINFYDLFGLNLKVKTNNQNWDFESINDLNTLNTARIFEGLRHSAVFKRYFRIKGLEDINLNIFTSYRSRAWNGTIGETEIKSAFGGFLENKYYFQTGKVKNNLNIRTGTAKYEAEQLKNDEIISLWRASLFSSLDSEYQIWRSNSKIINQHKVSQLSPVLINPELVLRTNINAAYFNYIDSVDQGFVKFSLGPEIRLGKLEREFLDYTKLSVMPGVKIKFGNSPFKFDNAIDLKTLKISLMQQIYGSLILDMISNINIDNDSENYGEYYDTKFGLLWHKRSYECGIYYHPNNDSGGFYFRINGFKFGNSVKTEF